MGVSYREELSKNRKKRKGRPESPPGSPRTEATERAALRKEYFGKSHNGRHQVASAQKRLIDAW